MSSAARVIPAPPSSTVPQLEPGDQLSREEFERRFDATPGLKKAELIDGIVHMPAAIRWDGHASPHADLMGCLVWYRWSTRGVDVGDNGSIRLALNNEPQPDAAMIIKPGFGGQVKISADDYIEGAPELVAEISASTVSIDLNKKLNIYRRSGVREYLVWRVRDRAIDWFSLRDGGYHKIPAQGDGSIHSEVFPGFWLNPAALVSGDVAAVQRTLQEGLASREHDEFVNTLRSKVDVAPG